MWQARTSEMVRHQISTLPSLYFEARKMGRSTECIFVKLFRLLFGRKQKKLTSAERMASRQLVKNITFKQHDFEWVDIRLGAQVQVKPKFKNSSIEVDHYGRKPANRIPRHLASIKHLQDFDREADALKKLWMKKIKKADDYTRYKIKRIFEVVRNFVIMELNLMFEVMAPGSPLLKDDFIRCKILEYTWDLHWEIEDIIEDAELEKRNCFHNVISLSMKSRRLKNKKLA